MFSGVSMQTSYSHFPNNLNWLFAVPNDLDVITRAKFKLTFHFAVQLVKYIQWHDTNFDSSVKKLKNIAKKTSMDTLSPLEKHNLSSNFNSSLIHCLAFP